MQGRSPYIAMSLSLCGERGSEHLVFRSDPQCFSSGFPLVQLGPQGCVPQLSLVFLHHDPST